MSEGKRIIVGIELLPIEEDGYHIFISGRINGRKARFLIDTGASRSVVDKERIISFFYPEDPLFEKIEKLSTGLGTNTMESNTILLKSISIGRCRITGYRAVALDLSHVNDSYALLKMKRIDGVIGSDLLTRLNALINYPEKNISFKP